MQVGNHQSINLLDKNPVENKTNLNKSSTDNIVNIKEDTIKTSTVANTTTKKNYISSNLDIEIKDKDGFENFGKTDIRAKVTGDIKLTKDFVLTQLATALKDNEEKKFNPPRFDEKRQQYVISGKAKNAVLNAIDINFEIRLGQKDGNLCFLVDSFITRGSIYSDLKKMLLEAGINTFEKDKTLFIKPTLGQTIDIPISKDKSQMGRIEWIDTNLDNTKSFIDKNGTVSVKVNSVDIIASTDINKINKTLDKPDIAKVKFDFSIDNDMKLKGKFSEGTINTGIRENTINLLGDNSKLIKESLGNAFTLSLTGLTGKVDLTEGMNLNADTNIKISSDDNKTQIDTKLNANINDKIVDIKADYLNGELKDNQKIIAKNIIYSNKQGINKISLNLLESNINTNGININAQGNTVIKNSKDDTDINFDGDLKANSNQENISGNLETKGKHIIKIGKNNIDINLDYAKISGKFENLITKKDNNINKKDNNSSININVKEVDAEAEINLEPANIKANINSGGVKVNINKQDIKVNTTATIKADAKGKLINGEATIKGGEVNIKDGNIDIKSNDVNAKGDFINKYGKLKVGGTVTGKTSVNIDKEGNVVVVQDGSFDAKLNSNNRIMVDSKGEKVKVELLKNEDIHVDLNNFEANTNLKLNNTRVKANTKGEEIRVKVTQEGDNISVKSKNTNSNATLNVNNIITGTGKVGDVDVNVNQSDKGDDVKVGLKNTEFKANIKNKFNNLNVDLNTKADANIHIERNGDVNVNSKNAISTTADFNLKEKNTGVQKIKASAIGKDFSVKVTDGKIQDIDVKLKSANYNTEITPGENLKTNINSEGKSDFALKITEAPEYTRIKLNSKSPLKGDISLKDNIKGEFTNKEGFSVDINENPKTTQIGVKVNELNIKGNADLDKNSVTLDGKGNLKIDINDEENKETQVSVEYNKYDVKGKISANDLAQGTYKIDGNLKVNVDGNKVSINNIGKVNADINSPKYGASANINMEGTKKDPVSININNGIGVKISHPGYIELKDLKSFNLGNNKDKTVDIILENLISKDIKIFTKNIDVKNNAQFVSTNLKTSEIKTNIGNIELSLNIAKENNTIEIKNGNLELTPSGKLYEMIEKEINEKYNIKISGKPELKDGILTIKGEVKSKAGVMQLADFNINMAIENNQLVLDLDKAKVLKVIGTNTVGNVLNRVLSKTDIDIFKINNKKMIIDLNDITKDLKLTQGINISKIDLKDKKFVIGFEYNSIDHDITGFAKKNDLVGLEKYLKTADYSNMTGKSISTAYGVFANSGNINKTSSFITDIANKYISDNSVNKKEFEEGLDWISKNSNLEKKNISDNISLEFTKKIGIKTKEGDNKIKQLPTNFIRNIADNMDKTITQGGGMSIIFQDERNSANYIRKLKGLPENKALF